MSDNSPIDAAGFEPGPPPVPCPKCGERQNVASAGFDPDGQGFDVHCMVCGHAFSRVEYKMGLAAVLNEPPKGLARDASQRGRSDA